VRLVPEQSLRGWRTKSGTNKRTKISDVRRTNNPRGGM
jgi:hypothetical protein